MSQETVHVEQIVCARIPTNWGEFRLCLYQNDRDEKEHLAFLFGDVECQENALVRVHSECFTGDVLGSTRCDCGEQLEASIAAIAENGSGALIYLHQEGRGIGLLEKLRAYNLQDIGYDTVEANLALGHQADLRDYSVAAEIIRHLKIQSIRLITNNPTKIEDLTQHGIVVIKRVSIEPTIKPDNLEYLRTKVTRMRHMLNMPELISTTQHEDD